MPHKLSCVDTMASLLRATRLMRRNDAAGVAAGAKMALDSNSSVVMISLFRQFPMPTASSQAFYKCSRTVWTVKAPITQTAQLKKKRDADRTQPSRVERFLG